MNTNAFLHNVRRLALPLACAGLVGMAASLQAAESYDNYIDVKVGSNFVSGDAAGFQKHFQTVKDGFGGIEDLFVTKEIDDSTVMKLRVKALAGENDYLFDLDITRDEVGFLKFGYKEYRVWYDGTGGYWPSNGFILRPHDEELAIDRGNLWFEAGYNKPDKVNVNLRYDLLTRKGTKDSTSWGDTGLAVSASATRGLLPTFAKIDEKRHVAKLDLSQVLANQNWGLGVRMDKGEYTNGRYERRRVAESSDRKITHKEGQDYDLFQIRGAYENRLNDMLIVTTAVARTTIDTVLSGSRIYGQMFDAVYDPVYAGRQQRDEGFYDLHGESEMEQTVATISAAYTPTKTLTIVPALRFEKIDWTNQVHFEETNVGASPSFTAAIEAVGADSEKDWKINSQTIEVRYTGTKDWVFNGTIEFSQSDGDLTELRILEPGTTHAAVSIDRDTNFERDTQKFAATANWYPKAGTTVAFQYYFKARQNDYVSPRDNTVSTADRYPAYIGQQDFETNDFNVRYSTKLAKNLRSVTRYDYQNTDILSQEVGLGFKESANLESHIISEALSWNPLTRWYLQANLSMVWDSLTTPAATLTGNASNLVRNSDNNYSTFTLGSGYALDKVSDLFIDYSRYQTDDNFEDNSAKTVPFGTDALSQTVGVTWTRQLTDRAKVTVKYAYADYEDSVYGGKSDYKAHLVYTKLQYRF